MRAPGVGVLVDAGPDPVPLTRCLDQLGVREVPLVFLTHLHADHVTGLSAVAGKSLKQVVTSGVRTPASGVALVDSVVGSGGRLGTATPGMAWTAGGVRVVVLAVPPQGAPSEAAEGESSAENDASLLLEVTCGGVSVLMAGDAQETGQGRILGSTAVPDVDVLLVPHHGSSSQSGAFLAASRPEIALISVGRKNDYGHPTKKTLALVGGLTPNIVRTDEHGSVAVGRRPEGELVVTTQT